MAVKPIGKVNTDSITYRAYLASPESSSFVCAILCHMIIVAIFLAALVTVLVIGEIATGNQGVNHQEATLE
jgi:hypothetical protein